MNSCLYVRAHVRVSSVRARCRHGGDVTEKGRSERRQHLCALLDPRSRRSDTVTVRAHVCADRTCQVHRSLISPSGVITNRLSGADRCQIRRHGLPGRAVPLPHHCSAGQ